MIFPGSTTDFFTLGFANLTYDVISILPNKCDVTDADFFEIVKPNWHPSKNVFKKKKKMLFYEPKNLHRLTLFL